MEDTPLTDKRIPAGSTLCAICEKPYETTVKCPSCGRTVCLNCSTEVLSGERVCNLDDGTPDPECEYTELRAYLGELAGRREARVDEVRRDHNDRLSNVERRLSTIQEAVHVNNVADSLLVLDGLRQLAAENPDRRTTITLASLERICGAVKAMLHREKGK